MPINKLHVYTGDGKGKTIAAMGRILAERHPYTDEDLPARRGIER